MNGLLRLLTLLLVTPAVALAAPRYGVFVYSNLCVEAESGDTAGNRITLMRFAEGDSVFYEYSEGPLAAPLAGSDVKIDQSGHVQFTVQAPGEEVRKVQGTLSKNGKALFMKDDWCGKADAMISLPLVTDFRQSMKPCAPCPAR